MNLTIIIIITVILTFIIVVIYRYITYNFLGWNTFTLKYHENFRVDCPIEKIYKIKFKDVIFTVTTASGKTISANVSSALNRMALGFKGVTNNKYIFKLTDPGLCPYSFNLPADLNYDPNIAEWSNANNITLTGKYKMTV